MSDSHDFHALKVPDLLEARAVYHRHLCHLDNIVGTAIGRYFIRRSDPDFLDRDSRLPSPGREVRTLRNSDVRPWSAPCVLVFVDDWPGPEALRDSPEEFVPPRLYLPDDRVVPTCVVQATRSPDDEPPLDDVAFAPDLLGGGYPLLSETQGQQRIGSVACLVTDGHTVYVLTNRHVAGPTGLEAFTLSHGEKRRVGEASGPSVWRIPMSEAYPSWPGARTEVNVDAGLIRVDDIEQWTSQVYGVGELGELLALDDWSLSLELVGTPVRAFGAVSGPLTGTVKALFYRHRSEGSHDVTADFLIGPDENQAGVPTRDGDSGTLWFRSEDTPRPRPFAMQWGSLQFGDGSPEEPVEFALASNLTTVCRRLGVRPVTDWETGLPETWGKLGHYQVGAKACDVVADAKLYRLMQANREQIGLSDDDRKGKRFPKDKQTAFIALADVPDLWWRTYRGKEGSTHFADVDEEGADTFAGSTLMDLFQDDPSTLTPETWVAFYEALGHGTEDQGLLPFRVRQFYEAMVGFVKQRKLAEFVAAAGILSHYVGDAAQPLHSSRLHHGHDASEKGVHAQYETKMVERFRAEIVDSVNTALKDSEITSSFTGAQRAAEVCMELMDFAMTLLPPQRIIDSYNAAGSGAARNQDMWDDLGADTLTLFTQSALYLAEIWESAWLEGGGDSIPQSQLVRITKTRLKQLYKNKKFLESKRLSEL